MVISMTMVVIESIRSGGRNATNTHLPKQRPRRHLVYNCILPLLGIPRDELVASLHSPTLTTILQRNAVDMIFDTSDMILKYKY